MERYETPDSLDMRAPCKKGCGCTRGTIMHNNGQDMMMCARCNTWQYNAPKTETGRAVRTIVSVHEQLKPKKKWHIKERANCRCELCGKGPPVSNLHVGHIISVKSGIELGMTDFEINSDENLMCLCDECNLGIGEEPMTLRLVLRVLRARFGFNGEPVASGA